jgi:L-alanine-DL-glutamate epimerase-like enolase superfamily enzyme
MPMIEHAGRGITLRQLQLEELRIPFKVSFRHASAERTETSSIWVTAASANGHTGYGESCPRDYVTGETIESCRRWFSDWQPALLAEPLTLAKLREWVSNHRTQLNANPAAWCAIELALLDLLAHEQAQTIETLLGWGVLPGSFQFTAVVGDAGAKAFHVLVEQYQQRGFTDFKIKLSGDLARDREKTAIFRSWPTGSFRLRVDANNLWAGADESIGFLQELDLPLFGIEEPIRPNQYAELARIGEAAGASIILDESLLRAEQFKELPPLPAGWLVNLRVSKMGGLLRSLEVIDAARQAGAGVIVGAQVGETSLLTRAGLTVAHAAGDLLQAQEGAFGTLLLERDICDPPLMFGAAGRIVTADHPSLQQPGFGLSPKVT